MLLLPEPLFLISQPPSRLPHHAGAAGEAAVAIEFGVQPGQALFRSPGLRLPPQSGDGQGLVVAATLHIDPADQTVALQNRKHVIAVAALGGGNEDLDPVVETEQALGALAVAQDRVERAQDTNPRRSGWGIARQVGQIGSGEGST